MVSHACRDNETRFVLILYPKHFAHRLLFRRTLSVLALVLFAPSSPFVMAYLSAPVLIRLPPWGTVMSTPQMRFDQIGRAFSAGDVCNLP